MGPSSIVDGNAHQRSKSSDTQPAKSAQSDDTESMEWELPPITNKAYVPLQDSIHGMKMAQNGDKMDMDFVVIEKANLPVDKK